MCAYACACVFGVQGVGHQYAETGKGCLNISILPYLFVSASTELLTCPQLRVIVLFQVTAHRHDRTNKQRWVCWARRGSGLQGHERLSHGVALGKSAHGGQRNCTRNSQRQAGRRVRTSHTQQHRQCLAWAPKTDTWAVPGTSHGHKRKTKCGSTSNRAWNEVGNARGNQGKTRCGSTSHQAKHSHQSKTEWQHVSPGVARPLEENKCGTTSQEARHGHQRKAWCGSPSYQEWHKVGHACGHQGVVHEVAVGGAESQAEALVCVLRKAEGFLQSREGRFGLRVHASCARGNRGGAGTLVGGW